VACVARRNSGSHRLRARRTAPAADKCDRRAQARRDPAHEKFYYLELLRRAGWIDQLQDDVHIALHVPEGAARESRGNIARSWRAGTYGARCDRRGRFLRLGKVLAARALRTMGNRFQAETDGDVILFGTAAEASVSNAIIVGMKKKPIDLTGKTAIGDLPALLSQCQLFLGNRFRAMHVAAAVGITGGRCLWSDDPFGTAPVHPRSSIVQERPYCSPCFLRRCPTGHRCMKASPRRWLRMPQTVAR